jgi:hypothetical protein
MDIIIDRPAPLPAPIIQRRNRFEQALFAQGGAVNGLAVSKALNEAYWEARNETRSTTHSNQDPAVQLILHQLCHLAAIPTDSDNGPWWDWDRAMEECKARCQSWRLLCLLGYENDVRLFVCDYPW